MDIEVMWHVGNKAKVTVDRELEVGQRYRISPSDGYAGVIPGLVRIVALWNNDDVESFRGDDDNKDAIDSIDGYCQATLDMCTDRNGDAYQPDYSNMEHYLDTTIWVVYEYPYGKKDSPEEGIQAFPIEEFIQHTSLV